ncbi:MAG: PD-(D/E)XK nuclease family protein [Flavobacteriales bacterium]|nr:PD-(D/E)XK nuclease family protein [Flavobacteriales bacterium]
MDSVTVEKEKYLGSIRNGKTEGGLADIVINHPRNSICIENKIYAKDQEKQLIRYHNYYVNGGKGGLLLYLTLYGNDASSLSTHSESPKISRTKNKDYFTISYKKDILSWLQKCQSESIDVPTVREAIGQYIYLIKKLTGQGMGTIEKKESINLIAKLGNSSQGQDDLIAIKRAFDVFLEDVEKKLFILKGKIELVGMTRKSTEIWSGKDQVNKLNSVLFIPLNRLPEGSEKDLKIRLSPKGWTVELWNGWSKDSKKEKDIKVIEDYEYPIEKIAKEVIEIIKNPKALSD